MVNSNSRRKRRIDGGIGYRTAFVLSLRGVSAVPNCEGGVSQHIGFNVGVTIVPRFSAATVLAAWSCGELAGNADTLSPGWNAKLAGEKATRVQRKSRANDSFSMRPVEEFLHAPCRRT